MGRGPDRHGPAVQEGGRRIQHGQDRAVRAEERHLPGHAVSGASRTRVVTEATTGRPHYLKRLWAELGTLGGEHDAFIKVIIVERIVKAAVLIALAIGLLVAGRKGWLAEWSEYAQDHLHTAAGEGFM